MTRAEEWRPIPSAPGWMASSEGRLCMPARQVPMPRGGFRTREVAPTPGQFCESKQRFRQSVYDRTQYVAPLICEAFHGPKPHAEWQCMHLDEDSTNNAASNLAWGSPSENMRAPKLAKARVERLAESHPFRRVSNDDIQQILQRRNTKARDLAAQYGISAHYVRQIWVVNGRPGPWGK